MSECYCYCCYNYCCFFDSLLWLPSPVYPRPTVSVIAPYRPCFCYCYSNCHLYWCWWRTQLSPLLSPPITVITVGNIILQNNRSFSVAMSPSVAATHSELANAALSATYHWGTFLFKSAATTLTEVFHHSIDSCAILKKHWCNCQSIVIMTDIVLSRISSFLSQFSFILFCFLFHFQGVCTLRSKILLQSV